MLNEFIRRIIVYPTDKTSLERMRRIDVELNYIGRFDVPIIPREPTEEEQTAKVKRLESAERKRQRDREYYYKCKAAAQRQTAKQNSGFSFPPEAEQN